MTTFSIQLLEINLKHHEEAIVKLGKPIARKDEYIQNMLTQHLNYKSDLEAAIKTLKNRL